ncbi:TonB-dependent receptor [Pseudomonas sichuanensis]|uniref:TonB-dependent siderophore receptor n=1 Tax=Pseudomonas sichuanensis TaxID=2213015 RepID=UPI00244ADF28|nr:TonB-dependent siderophore receptor [Pseudomonas sichuanensis]MDH0730013.1 TonB-dependent receptor [Pseudomonas sichuanensis]MDH1584519.1 TonB-dependent receptor [Pseudomonas sichuanensis]MDH1593647.1 TonB-dependent receptor [Pseudomonas sichuanensis]MDH1600182.1 TonB-dependent receptor [Pseudomonas sichuanensis]
MRRFPGRPVLSPLTLCLRLACAGLILPAMVAPVAAQDEARLHFEVPAGNLAEVLGSFAQQAGVAVVFEPEVLAGRHSEGLHGLYSVDSGFAVLLAGSGYRSERSDNGYRLVAEPQAALGAGVMELGVTTVAGQGMGESTENTGSYAPGLVSVGSKSPTSVRQTPQSVSVVTRQLIEDQQLTDINQAMKVTPGIITQSTTFRTQDFISRGFSVQNLQIDGAAPQSLGTSMGSFYSSNILDLAEFDHVEVLRGAGALFGGSGDPGGIINLVRKRPTAVNQFKFTLSAGSWDNYRQEVDLSGPLGWDGRLRGRLVLANTDRQYFTDNRASEKPLVYGVLEADLTDDTMLTFGARYNKAHETGTQSAVPRYANGADLGLPRHTGLTQSWAYLDATAREYFVKLDHRFNDDWKLNLSYTNIWDLGLFKTASTLNAVNPATGRGVTWYGTLSRQENEQDLYDANLSGHFQAFGLDHEVVVGADYQKIDSRWLGTPPHAGSGAPANVFDPDATPFPEQSSARNYSRDYSPNSQRQYGLYASLRLQLAEPLHLIVGGRAQRYHFWQTYQSLSAGAWQTVSNVDQRIATKVTPFGGLVYDLDDQWSAYASYSEIYKPQSNRLAGPQTSSSTLEPMTGKTYETGLKGELFDGALNTNIALYYTTREDEAVRDPGYPQTSALFAGSCCYLPSGKVMSKGIDLEVSGELMPDWMLIGGYTYNLNRNRTDGAPLSTVMPKHLFKLYTTYRLPGVLNDFKVGGGVQVQSATYVSGTASEFDSNGAVLRRDVPFDYAQAGYTIWNGLVEYRIDEHWDVTLNGNNLFDKKYYETVGGATYGNSYGEPRNFMLTLRGSY